MAPTKIGKYSIIKTIDQGGMAKIYLAKMRGYKQPIVLKKLIVLHEKDIIQRFLREAKIMNVFHHPNIVKVIDYFKSGSQYYIAMEFVDGLSLDKLIKTKEKISPKAGMLIFHQVCLGLQYAHGKGIIHRDIKPANVLIGKNGEVKLTDFGIATPLDTGSHARLTKTGFYFGTPAFISPEQLESAKNVDARSDIYSLGAMLYEMMTGSKPFKSNFNSETISSIYKGKYVKPQKLNPNIPGKIRAYIKKAMNVKMEKRYPNMEKLLKAISPFARKYKKGKAMQKQIKNYLSGKE